MNVTKDILKGLIREELDKIAEVTPSTAKPGSAPTPSGPPPSATKAAAPVKTDVGGFRKMEKERTLGSQAGITDEERTTLHNLAKRMQALAAKKDLGAAGMVTTLLVRLNKELDKQLKV